MLKFLTHGLFPILLDESGDADGGGGDAPKTLTQDDVNRLLAAERRKYEAKLKELSPKATEAETLRAELDKLREEKELAGKTEIEKLERKYQNDVAALQKQIAERESAAKSASEALHRERVTTRLQAELGRAKVLPNYLDKAVKLASLELQDIAVSDDGKIVASYGDLIEKPIADVVAAWVKDNENFLPAPSGGAGTRSPNGSQMPADLWALEPKELLALDAKRRASR